MVEGKKNVMVLWFLIAGSNPAPSTNAEGRVETIPASRRKHLLRSLARWEAKATDERFMKQRYGPCEPSDRNGIEIDFKANGVERDGIQPVSTAKGKEVISESMQMDR